MTETQKPAWLHYRVHTGTEQLENGSERGNPKTENGSKASADGEKSSETETEAWTSKDYSYLKTQKRKTGEKEAQQKTGSRKENGEVAPKGGPSNGGKWW